MNIDNRVRISWNSAEASRQCCLCSLSSAPLPWLIGKSMDPGIFSVDLFLTLSATLDRWVVKQLWDIPPPLPPYYVIIGSMYIVIQYIHTQSTHSQKCWDPWRQVSWADSCSQTRQLPRQTRVLQTSRLCHWSKDWGLQAQVYHHRCRRVCAKVYGGPCWRVPSRNTELSEEKAWQTATWTNHGSRQGMMAIAT